MGSHFSSPFSLESRLGTYLPSGHAVLDIEPSQRIIPSIFPLRRTCIPMTAARTRPGGDIYAGPQAYPPLVAWPERTRMAARRLSRLQRQILRCLLTQAQRTPGVIGMGHRELVQTLREQSALRADSENLSPVLRDRLVARLRRTCPV